ncbi:DNA-protecting protein DprA [Xenorhabdus sp. XENO-1]|uniref:DNA-processing protein DprA n=1 Tax=Xenorhabdus bovienii TaxID=40576 RepID=UPI0020CA8308|nr:DNA-processing protein DprA [Xenorhabdus bovienii]MCP9269168.1 DNA-protecting protein DprA [Xenorhabdus bovienii subsp. africana]
MADTETARWNTESAALLALSEIRGVSYWSLYRVAQKGVRFRDIVTCQTLSKFESMLGVKLHRHPYSLTEDNWSIFREGMISAAKSLLTHYHATGYKIIHYGSPEYPEKLNELSDPPYWLFAQGDLSLLNKKCVGVVGTRNPTALGIYLTQAVVAQFIDSDYVTVSGLAYGVDQTAHEASLLFNIPTIAVLGTGVNSNYPKSSVELRGEIINRGGLILTEYLPDQKSSQENFVRRNRIQAALSDILIPVEWNLKSGTSHTVRNAAQLKRTILCPLLRGEAIREEIKYAKSEYSALILDTPLSGFQDVINLIKSSSNKQSQQLSLLGDE